MRPPPPSQPSWEQGHGLSGDASFLLLKLRDWPAGLGDRLAASFLTELGAAVAARAAQATKEKHR